jgi:hypothetical protein
MNLLFPWRFSNYSSRLLLRLVDDMSRVPSFRLSLTHLLRDLVGGNRRRRRSRL